jgi:DNA-binding MarR family transcriptional regulator
MTQNELKALRAVSDKAGISCYAVARAINPKYNATGYRIIRRLQQMGYLSDLPGRNARERILFLTSKAYDVLYSPFPADDYDSLMNY